MDHETVWFFIDFATNYMMCQHLIVCYASLVIKKTNFTALQSDISIWFHSICTNQN